jgi:hypothetical protein
LNSSMRAILSGDIGDPGARRGAGSSFAAGASALCETRELAPLCAAHNAPAEAVLNRRIASLRVTAVKT